MKKIAVLPASAKCLAVAIPNSNYVYYSARIYVDIYGRQQRNTKSIYKLTYKKAIYANIERF